jgi:hypothetical protein
LARFRVAQRFTAAIKAEFDLKRHVFSRATDTLLLKKREKWRTRPEYHFVTMPKSRKRSRRRKRQSKHRFNIRTEVSRFFEEIGLNPEKDLPHPVLYHYTSMSAALKILESQKFWATAHDCTNDTGELVSANSVILEIARFYRQTASGLATKALDLFLRNYDAEMIARVRTAYLSCFSIARDDEKQWQRYGDEGCGVCLGLKVINEPAPLSRELFSRLFQVVYSEDSLREWFFDTFGRVCAALAAYPPSDQNARFTLATLRGLAAFASITTKTFEWRSEQEVRHVTMDRLEPGVTPFVRISADGKEVRYLPVSLRAKGKLIAFDEIIIGGKRDFGESRKQFEDLLASKGYVLGSIEYPRFVVSSVSVGPPTSR